MKLKQKIGGLSKGQFAGVDNLVPLAVALVTLTVILGVGSIIIGDFTEAGYDSLNVNNETFNATSDPYTHTVSVAGDAGFVELTSVTCYADLAQSTELTGNDCNISDAGAGDVTVSTTVDGGNESLDFVYDAESDNTNVFKEAQDAILEFADFFTIIIVVGVAAVIFLLLSVVRRNGMTAGA